MKWRLRFLWMKMRPLATLVLLIGIPYLPLAPWFAVAGPEPFALSPILVSQVSTSPPTPVSGGAGKNGPSPPLDAAEIRKRSQNWEVRRLDGGWRLLMSPRFAVRGDARVDDLRTVAAFAECYLDAVHERIGGDMTDIRFSIRAYAREGEFRRHAACLELEAARSFYDAHHAEIVLHVPPTRDRSELAGALMHEVVHEFLDRVHDRTGPAWFVEGLAGWFTDYTLEMGRPTPARRDPTPEVAAAARDSKLIPLRRLTGLDLGAFLSDEGALMRAEAASLVRYYAGRDPGLLKHLAAGRHPPSDLAPERVEKEWIEWVLESGK